MNTDPDPDTDRIEAALRLHLDRSRTAEADAVARNTAHQADLAAIATRLREADARQAALAAEVAALRTELAALKRSTSWRITAPVRMLVRGLRRVRSAITR